MVRLKYYKEERSTVYRKFQFHYGSIKINGSVKMLLMFCSFQFHYGSIKIFHNENVRIAVYLVSIPLWFD